MFHLIRKFAFGFFMLAQRFYMAAPASAYEAILFGYVKATIAQLFFREVVRGVS